MFTLLEAGENSFLKPEILRLMTLVSVEWMSCGLKNVILQEAYRGWVGLHPIRNLLRGFL